MPIFGYDPVLGYKPATGPAILADLQARYIAETEANVDVTNGPVADTLRTVSGLFLASWQGDQGTYDSRFISAAPGTGGVAGGSSLELLLAPKIGPKLVAAPSTVTLPLTAAPGPAVNVPGGSQVRIAGETQPWTIAGPVVIPGGGSIDAEFAYAEAGKKQAIAGTTWEIATPVSGWLTAGPNAADAVLGRLDETDAEYRARYRASVGDEFVRELAQLDGVSSVTIIEWRNGWPDAFWQMTHWVEALIVGGDDEEIARTLTRFARAKGVQTMGNTIVSYADPEYIDGTVTERFSRPVAVQTFVEVTVTKGQGYPTDNSAEAIAARVAAIKGAVFDRYAALVAGESISQLKLSTAISTGSGIPGIDDLAIKFDTIDPPINVATLTPGQRERYTVALVDIDVLGA